MPKKYNMFWNWIRWQCFNKTDWNWGEIPKGTMIDDGQFTLVVMELLKCQKSLYY